MKKLLFSLIGFLCFQCLWAQSDYKPKLYLVKNLDGASIQMVNVKTSGGNIQVEGGTEKPRVEVYIQSNQGKKLSEAEIKEILDKDYEMGINTSDGKLDIFARSKPGFKNWNHGLSISFTIYIPSSVSTDLSTSGGNIDMNNITGALQKFSTSGGNLKLDKMSGNIQGKTSGGNIDLNNLKGEILLSTSGGNIDAEHCQGNLSLTTSGGNVKIESISGNLQAKTSGGNIVGSDIKGNLEGQTSGGNVELDRLACTLESSTSGGEMKISMVSLGKFVRLQDSGGEIFLSLPGKSSMTLTMSADKIHINDTRNFNGTNTSGKLKGTINGGGIPITVTNSSGDIQVELKN